MATIANWFEQAFTLLLSLDSEIYGITVLSIIITMLSVGISTVVSVPLGCAIGLNNFPFKKLIEVVIHTLMGLPPVVAGLVVFLLLSRSGPFGRWQLLFTPTAMIIAQLILIVPIITGLTAGAVKDKGRDVWYTSYTLGASRVYALWTLLKEFRTALMSTVVTGFGRSISEVGAVMIVGGNIKGHTRVMTTAIVLETGKGNFDKAIAVGIILLVISFTANLFLYKLQSGERYGYRV